MFTYSANKAKINIELVWRTRFTKKKNPIQEGFAYNLSMGVIFNLILLIRTSSVLLSQNVLISITDYQLMFIVPQAGVWQENL